jgi:hypothetical protein
LRGAALKVFHVNSNRNDTSVVRAVEHPNRVFENFLRKRLSKSCSPIAKAVLDNEAALLKIQEATVTIQQDNIDVFLVCI